MKLIGLIRLGRDAEVRYSQDGTPVAGLAGAWNYGRKGDDGKRPTQWADFSIWGDRAEKLAPFLQKGKQLMVVADDVHVETFEGRNGFGAKLVGRVDSIEFAGDRQEGSQASAPAAAPRAAAPAPAPQQRQAPAPRPGGATGFDDMDDDIPFLSFHAEHDPMIVDRKARRTKSTR